MSFFDKIVAAAGPAIRSALAAATKKRDPQTRPPVVTRQPPGSVAPASDTSPGRYGAERTAEIDPSAVGRVQTSYAPDVDGDPDPGEVVWTWVPYEENNGQGKDRPVLIVARKDAGTVLAVQLTSKQHDGQSEFVPVGSGGWDGSHRESWVNLERVFEVHPGGMRRESVALPRPEFDVVANRLHVRYGWT